MSCVVSRGGRGLCCSQASSRLQRAPAREMTAVVCRAFPLATRPRSATANSRHASGCLWPLPTSCSTMPLRQPGRTAPAGQECSKRVRPSALIAASRKLHKEAFNQDLITVPAWHIAGQGVEGLATRSISRPEAKAIGCGRPASACNKHALPPWAPSRRALVARTRRGRAALGLAARATLGSAWCERSRFNGGAFSPQPRDRWRRAAPHRTAPPKVAGRTAPD